MKPALKYYLLAYNGIAFMAWLGYAVVLFFKGGDSALLLLNIAQGLAILEIIHALLGWVRSPIGSTAAQVASRILVLVLLNLYLPDEDQAWVFVGVSVVSFAWIITELVRYSFYFSGLLGDQPRWLLWMRYSFFILLYPIGVTGEWLVVLSPLLAYGFSGAFHVGPYAPEGWNISLIYYSVFAAFLAVSYIYYFPVLYGYMWRQRRAKLSPSVV